MTINPAEYVAPEAPLTPRNDGKVEFLGPDTVKYISPPRIETARCRTAPPPPVRKEPPPYHVAVPSPPTVQYPVVPVVPPPQIIYAVSPPVHQHVQPVQQASPPSITVNVNASPQSVSAGSVGGGGGALVCPKCRKGIVTRQQDRFRKRVIKVLAVCCCPLTCGLPLLCLCCNYVDACACCGKNYGHRGRKSHKKKVNAVTL